MHSCSTEIPGDIIHRTKSQLLAGVHGCQIVMLCCQIGIKYPREGNNSVILKDKNSKILHNFHMAITNLNPHGSYENVYIMVLL